jgi:hypothetical protein
MKKIIIVFILSIIVIVMATEGFAQRFSPLPKNDEIVIHFSGVELPLNRILLIRKGGHYCALRFIRAWTEIDQKKWKSRSDDINKGGILGESARDMATKKYAVYESFYQIQGSPDFLSKNIQKQQRTASWLPIKGFMHPFLYQPGNPYIECGELQLDWGYRTFVSFIPADIPEKNSERDHGIELAPTIWTDIKQVNVKDPRIRWYSFDEKREPTYISINNFWAPKNEDVKRKTPPTGEHKNVGN